MIHNDPGMQPQSPLIQTWQHSKHLQTRPSNGPPVARHTTCPSGEGIHTPRLKPHGACFVADKKWGSAYLTRDFFDQLQASMPDRVLLVMAEDESGTAVAGALNLIGSRALFGRNWGCAWGLQREVPSL